MKVLLGIAGEALEESKPVRLMLQRDGNLIDVVDEESGAFLVAFTASYGKLKMYRYEGISEDHSTISATEDNKIVELDEL